MRRPREGKNVEQKQSVRALLQRDAPLTKKAQLRALIQLSLPAIFAQLTSIMMQYIDAAMVGALGAEASAAIGVVSTSTWLLSGLCTAAASGFSVQVAQRIGAADEQGARSVVKHGLLITLLFALALSFSGSMISSFLPGWLGADPSLHADASGYFLIYVCALPFLQMSLLGAYLLQCSGDMKVPSILNASMCGLDVIFNLIFIRCFGVLGAAMGTALAQGVVAVMMLYAALVRSPQLHLRRGERFVFDWQIVRGMLGISLPMALEHAALCGAQIATTRIIAPLGTVSIAANSFAVTAESLCYMPGYGIGNAATTVVGQSVGARRKDLARSFANLSVILGIGVMSAMAVIMYALCPMVFALLTPDAQVRVLAAEVLRLELFAEPLYAASIVVSGALRGARDTLIPSLLNLVSIWGVRIPLSLWLVGPMGLAGAWIAMAVELCVRGILLLIRQLRGRWLGIIEQKPLEKGMMR